MFVQCIVCVFEFDYVAFVCFFSALGLVKVALVNLFHQKFMSGELQLTPLQLHTSTLWPHLHYTTSTFAPCLYRSEIMFEIFVAF